MKRGFLALALAAAVLVGSVSAQEYANGDRKKLQGEWEVVGFTIDGNKTSLPGVDGLKWTIKADTIASTLDGKDRGAVPYNLDETRKPRRIEIAKVAYSYQLDGDILKIAIAPTGASAPPAAFEGKDVMVMTLQRIPRKP